MGHSYQIIIAGIRLNLRLNATSNANLNANKNVPASDASVFPGPPSLPDLPGKSNLSSLSGWLLRPGDPLFDPSLAGPTVEVPATDLLRKRPVYEAMAPGPVTDEMLEYELLVYRVSDALMRHGAFLFHGVAFECQGRGYILTGPSGVGKTTQYRNWRRSYGDEVRVLNGDKPVLQLQDNRVLIHPSPWHGKEGLGSGSSVPLAGIISLEQAPENSLQRLSPSDAVWPIFSQVLHTASDPEILTQALDVTDRLLSRTPVWRLRNCGDLFSTDLLRKNVIFTYK